MKKITGLFMCICIILCTCSIGAVSAEVPDYSVSGGNTAVATEISADEFAGKVAAMIEEYDHIRHTYDSDNAGFATARLIVKSREDINVQGAVSVVGGFDGLWVIQYATPDEAAAAYERFEADGNVEFVEADKPVISASTDESMLQTAAAAKYISWGPSHIGIKTLNNKLKIHYPERAKVYVAVVDTGVDESHPFFEGRVEPTRINTSGTGVRNSSNDDNGHGTQVAGVIADSTLENVIIKPYKVLDRHGNGTVISLAAGINCAVDDGVDVINVSVGFYEDSPVLKAAVDNAQANDIVVVSAAGNNNTDEPMYPSSYESVIRVAAVNDQNVVTNFSNYGGIDVAAPGFSILTTTLNGGYTMSDGTSLASPFVAAVAATILGVNTDASSEDVENMIKSLAVRPFEPNAEKNYGAGVLAAPTIEHFTASSKTEEPVFSVSSGIYRDALTLTVTCKTQGAEIYYTTDESVPSKINPNAVLYTQPIEINKSSKLFAVAYADGYYRSEIADFSAIIAPYPAENELVIDANGVITTYSGTLKSLSIPEKVNGITVKKLGDGVLKNRGLTELILPECITSIGKESIADNPDLKTVMATGVSSVDEKAFYNCINLKNVFLGAIQSVGEYSFYNVGSKVFEIRRNTFALNIENLAYVPEGAFMNSAISEADISVPLTLGNNAFANCNGLVNVDFDELQNLDAGAFKGLKSLKKVSISKLDFVPKEAFSGCDELMLIALPDAEFIDSCAFENCASAVQIEIPKAKTVYSDAFMGCDSLKTLRLESATEFEPEAYTSNVIPPLPKNLLIFNAPKLKRTPNRLFANCSKLYVAELSGATELGVNTFNGCKAMYYVDIRNVEYIKTNAFGSCSIMAVDARKLVSTTHLPSDSGIILSNAFVESQNTAENLTVYGTPGTYVERYCEHKGYTFVGIPLIYNEIPEYITENSETVMIFAIGFDLEYQWYWNNKKSTEGGTPISGATENSYTFTQSDTAPYYYCKITHQDFDKDVVIYSDIITKDSTPADYSAYNEAVKAARAIDTSKYTNAEILEEALAVDVSNRYSCEQDFVDAQTQAIYNAIANLKTNGVESLLISASEITSKPFKILPLNYMVYPANAQYEGIIWSCEQNKDVVLLNRNGYVRIIGSGQAIIKGEITNADGSTVTSTCIIEVKMNPFDDFIAKIFKPFWLLIYAMSGQKIS